MLEMTEWGNIAFPWLGQLINHLLLSISTKAFVKDVFGFAGPSSGLQTASAVAPDPLVRPLTH
jgi:hypothetical protein